MMETFEAKIYCGLWDTVNNIRHSLEQVYEECQRYVEKGLCVSVTPTRFIYTGGSEEGAIIGFIAYPRFPSTKETIRENALELTHILMEKFNQKRMSVVDTETTTMLENPKHNHSVDAEKELSEWFSKKIEERKNNIDFNKISLLEEDLWCVHNYLDDNKVPRTDKDGNEYSIIGRIRELEKKYLIKMSALESQFLSTT